MNHIYLPLRNQRRKKRIDVVKTETSIDLENFILQYNEHHKTDKIPPVVFNDLEKFRAFVKTIPDKRPMVHKSCIKDTQGVCLHYMNGKDHCKAVLYGYERV